MSKKGLGKGLSALIPTDNDLSNKSDENVLEIEIHKIKPNSFQPRRNFDPDKLQELVDSINIHGVIQPIVVRPNSLDTYELVVGERRFRACQKLGIKKIPAVIKDYNDQQMLEIAIIENIQRHELNPIEEALAYKKLIDDFNMTQDEVAKKLGKSRPFVANLIRILNLPKGIQESIINNSISVGHARSLLSLEDSNLQKEIVDIVIKENYNVRQTENLVKKVMHEKNNKNKAVISKINNTSPVYNEIESRLRSLFGTKVQIKNSGDKGKIEIEYYSSNDLERIIDKLIKDGL